MFGSLMWKPSFREEVDKFIEAAKNHAMTLTQNKDSIICLCHNCKNHIAWRDVDIIRSHLIMRVFAKDYIVWIHHGEMIIVNDDNDPKDDDETLETLSQYSAELDARMDPEFGNEQGGDAGGWDGNDEGGANNDGGARVGDEDDFDDLEDMILALEPKILLKSPKGLENLERAALVVEPLVVDELSLVRAGPVRVKGRCRNPSAINGYMEFFFNGEGINLKFEAEGHSGAGKGGKGPPWTRKA
jgi:hypothetical protein